MKNLINFLIKYSYVFLFVALEAAALLLISSDKSYRQSVILSSCNDFAANMYALSNNIVEFFNLRTANNSLSEENTELKNEIIELQNQLASRQLGHADSLRYRIPPEMQYRFIQAKVIGNTTNKMLNYITLNKGASDGILPDMGVVSESGVVGIVKTVSEHFSTVVSLLNPRFQLSCKYQRNNYVGSLKWHGYDYRFSNLMDIARHVDIRQNDTIVTSGLTMTFPEGIPVGTVDEFHIDQSDPYYTIKVRLTVDFRTLTHVSVIYFKYAEEEKSLQNQLLEEDGND
ncbi:MAG: rod shape-determining protein MreC [Prevotellaceae bacterium]|jgi:rod shape-determining protein MreC|nr:rod shape-determining protein MreC [Prevotellaceae bacterium]